MEILVKEGKSKKFPRLMKWNVGYSIAIITFINEEKTRACGYILVGCPRTEDPSHCTYISGNYEEELNPSEWEDFNGEITIKQND